MIPDIQFAVRCLDTGSAVTAVDDDDDDGGGGDDDIDDDDILICSLRVDWDHSYAFVFSAFNVFRDTNCVLLLANSSR